VFASIANYLKNSGWDAQRTWGREVRLPADFDVALASRDNRQPLSEWQRLGVRQLKGQDLPRVAIDGRIVIPDADTTKPAFLVYGNYDAILRWNRSNLFALAVGHLSDRFNE
jgi:membrane-bound lytic murein transglycosylase B